MMVRENLKVENARLIFKNFAGEATKFKREGSREFSIVFDHETGLELSDKGWNVRPLRPRDEDELPNFALTVAVSYDRIPPEIYMIKGRKKVLLDEDTIATLDHAEIEFADVVVRPYNWNVNGKTGVKAYAKEMYVVLRDNAFADKYSDFDGDYEDSDEMPF